MKKEEFIKLTREVSQDVNFSIHPKAKNLRIMVSELQNMPLEDYKLFVFYWKAFYKQLSSIIRSCKLHRKTKFLQKEYSMSSQEAISQSSSCDIFLHVYLKVYARKMLTIRDEKREAFKNVK